MQKTRINFHTGQPLEQTLGVSNQVFRERSNDALDKKTVNQNGDIQLEMCLPSLKNVDPVEIDQVEKQLSKTQQKKTLLEEELDKVESKPNSLASIKRKREIEQELKECQLNMNKFKRYLKVNL
jgi:hypothetical protein